VCVCVKYDLIVNGHKVNIDLCLSLCLCHSLCVIKLLLLLKSVTEVDGPHTEPFVISGWLSRRSRSHRLHHHLFEGGRERVFGTPVLLQQE